MGRLHEGLLGMTNEGADGPVSPTCTRKNRAQVHVRLPGRRGLVFNDPAANQSERSLNLTPEAVIINRDLTPGG